jgi:hypothetical protein
MRMLVAGFLAAACATGPAGGARQPRELRHLGAALDYTADTILLFAALGR